MNNSSLHGSPSTQHPIASQDAASAAAAKAAHAKLRKRPEDDVPPDSTALAPSDQEVVAQAGPAGAADGSATESAGIQVAAADAAASGGGAANASGGATTAAEGSAGAGAGAPAAPAAGGGGGIGFGALALGGGIGIAAAAAGGGGGGGGGGSGNGGAAPVPAPAAVNIHNFGEYMAAVNQSGTTAATHATGSPRLDGSVIVDISGGVSRGVLPKTLADLRPMNYNVSGASAATINDGGIAVDLQSNPDSHVTAHSNAGAASSNLMWMQTLAVRDQAAQGMTVATASATAGGAGSDAEIGIQHVSMALAGSARLDGRTDLAATATAGGSAHTLVGDVTLGITGSGVGTSDAPVDGHVHMGAGEGAQAGILAAATGAGSSATVGAGNISLNAHGDSVYAYNSGIFSQGTDGGAAHTDIANLSFASTGREAHAYVLIDASTDGSAGSAGDVHVHGNVDLDSSGSDRALTRAAVRADGTGTVEIDGHLSLDSSSGTSAESDVQVMAQGGHVSIGAIDMNVNGGGGGWMDLYTDHSGGLTIGAVNLSAIRGADITVNVQHANLDSTLGMIDDTFRAHGVGTGDVSIATANVGGAGEVHMNLNSQTFGTINQAASLERLDIHYQLADQDSAGVGAAPMTTLNGFTGDHTTVIYDGVLADGTNFSNAGSFDSLTSLNAGLNAALDGTHKYVFAVYNGTEDINHNGVADDHGSGVLAWDDNGAGITSVLMLPGVTTLTANDLA